MNEFIRPFLFTKLNNSLHIKYNLLSKSSKWELGFVHYIGKFTRSRFVISRFECIYTLLQEYFLTFQSHLKILCFKYWIFNPFTFFSHLRNRQQSNFSGPIFSVEKYRYSNSNVLFLFITTNNRRPLWNVNIFYWIEREGEEGEYEILMTNASNLQINVQYP